MGRFWFIAPAFLISLYGCAFNSHNELGEGPQVRSVDCFEKAPRAGDLYLELDRVSCLIHFGRYEDARKHLIASERTEVTTELSETWLGMAYSYRFFLAFELGLKTEALKYSSLLLDGQNTYFGSSESRNIVQCSTEVLRGTADRELADRCVDSAVKFSGRAYLPIGNVRQWLVGRSLPIIYPAEAINNPVKGEVVLEYSVTKHGKTTGITVYSSTLPDYFSAFAIREVERLRYLPRREAGKATQADNQRYRIYYSLD